MRLSHLNLCGFKSFVDPTTVAFPSNLVGVVGPNGCGKSNVIDAVRWVMGESSAKNLRGSSMADVIFNGSHKRNPAEYAEVELVFRDVELPQYPDTPEIAVKRRLTKDGKSQYFLNGVSCRRKDVTGVFLGTGLGPRSYSIIEQGMISRFIEAKPEDLRMFLEEAAGVSRYKERRRETELRIQHTQENLARLEDSYSDLAKHLDRLKRQMRAAEKYKQLKEAEKLLKGQLLAMRWNNYNEQVVAQESIIETGSGTLEQQNAQLAEQEARYEAERAQFQETRAAWEQIQEKYYQQQAEVDRLQQSIQHAKEKHAQVTWDLEQNQRSFEETQRTLQEDRVQIEQLGEEIEIAQTELEEVRFEAETLQQALEEAEMHQAEGEQAWEAFSQRQSEPVRQREVEQTRIANLEQRLQQNRDALQKLNEESQSLDTEALEQELEMLQAQLLEQEALLEELQSELEGVQAAIVERRESIELSTQNLHDAQERKQQLRGRLSSLEALQEAALGQNDDDVRSWLGERGIDDNTPRLAQVINVEPGWERAVETVLESYLEALCIEDLSHLSERLDSLPQGKFTVVDTRLEVDSANVAQTKGVRLSDKVRADWVIDGLLAGVYVADTLAEAYSLREQLAAYESVITAQGLWLGPNWLRVNEEVDHRSGIFAREQDILQIQETLRGLEGDLQNLSDILKKSREQLRDLEAQRETKQQQLNQSQRELSQVRSESSTRQERLQHMQQRMQRTTEEIALLNTRIAEDGLGLEEARERLLNAEQLSSELAAEYNQLQAQRMAWRQQVEQAREKWQQNQEGRHQISSRLQSMQTDKSRLEQGVQRLQMQLEQLQEKAEDLRQMLENADALEEWQMQHEEQQILLQASEMELAQSKEAVQHLEESIRQLEEQQRELEAAIAKNRSALEQVRLDYQTNLVRRQTVEEQLAEADYDIQLLLAELPPEATEKVWQEGIEDVESKILKLGSINLAAMEEYDEQDERKKYLDAQFDDLRQAMELLQQAIESIDQEIRGLLQDTLDTVNGNFQVMFPRLFGGGEATLRLTGDDILSSGVAVMARPPGKRNSTIHLLSGGEKALTAVSLVFSIFELNPAPFCMLDEVDAPLDDSNVGRFCALVKDMSEHVQFIFISHNKITMEIADQLVGVTMQEAGVSRPVAVDIDLAVEMAEMDALAV